jgi:hypothetical protein
MNGDRVRGWLPKPAVVNTCNGLRVNGTPMPRPLPLTGDALVVGSVVPPARAGSDVDGDRSPPAERTVFRGCCGDADDSRCDDGLASPAGTLPTDDCCDVGLVELDGAGAWTEPAWFSCSCGCGCGCGRLVAALGDASTRRDRCRAVTGCTVADAATLGLLPCPASARVGSGDGIGEATGAPWSRASSFSSVNDVVCLDVRVGKGGGEAFKIQIFSCRPRDRQGSTPLTRWTCTRSLLKRIKCRKVQSRRI